MTFRVPNHLRVRRGLLGTSDAAGLNGLFFVPTRPGQPPLRVIATDGLRLEQDFDWEHVSVSLFDRLPTWDEMCRVKALFWDDEDTVMQLHPPKSEWISNHAFCLHLWRSRSQPIPRPPSWMVGDASLGTVYAGPADVRPAR